MSLAIDRRAFLRLAALGLPSAVIAEKMGLAEKVRSYFFAPRQGWMTTGWTPKEFYVPGTYAEITVDAGTLTARDGAPLYRAYEASPSSGAFEEGAIWCHPRDLQRYRKLFGG